MLDNCATIEEFLSALAEMGADSADAVIISPDVDQQPDEEDLDKSKSASSRNSDHRHHGML